MENISMNQALGVWSELWQAFYGENGYGGDTAEVYAYTLMPHIPALAKETTDDAKSSIFKEIQEETALSAAKSLYALLSKFSKDNECKIEIEGDELGEWLLKTPFRHRWHVKIIRN